MTKPIADVAFRVPHTVEGKHFIILMRKFINRDRYSQVLTRPRGGTQVNSRMHDSQRADCKWLGVYLSNSKAIQAVERADWIEQDDERRAELDNALDQRSRGLNKLHDIEIARQCDELQSELNHKRIIYADALAVYQRGEVRLQVQVIRLKLAVGFLFLIGLAIGIVATHQVIAGQCNRIITGG